MQVHVYMHIFVIIYFFLVRKATTKKSKFKRKQPKIEFDEIQQWLYNNLCK